MESGLSPPLNFRKANLCCHEAATDRLRDLDEIRLPFFRWRHEMCGRLAVELCYLAPQCTADSVRPQDRTVMNSASPRPHPFRQGQPAQTR